MKRIVAALATSVTIAVLAGCQVQSPEAGDAQQETESVRPQVKDNQQPQSEGQQPQGEDGQQAEKEQSNSMEGQAIDNGSEEWATYTGYVEGFSERDLDGDGLTDKLYRTYEENKTEDEAPYVASYELHFGNGEKLLLNRSGDDYFFNVMVDSMDLTGDGQNEIIVVDTHEGSTNPAGARELAVYTRKEDGYYRMKLPGQKSEEKASKSRRTDDYVNTIGIAVNMTYRKDNTLLCENAEYGYREEVPVSSSYMSDRGVAVYYEELDGTVWSSSIYRYQPVIRDGRVSLLVNQQVGYKGLPGDISYLLTWDEKGDYNVSDISFELSDYDFRQHERYDAEEEFKNLNLDGDGIADSARMYESKSAKAYVEVRFGDGKMLEIRQTEELKFSHNFKIMAVDSDSDGEKEIFLLLNTGKQGGDGEYTLVAYDKQGEDYVEVQMPEAFLYTVTGDGEKVVLSCEELGYEEELFGQECGEEVKALWEEKRKQAFGTTQADGFCDFSFYRPYNGTEEYEDSSGVRIQLKQYLYGDGHSDLLAYAITDLVYEDGQYVVCGSEATYPVYGELAGE
ncbi:hypothetical protein EDD76_11387 [Kineothrix alysoides]|uniref:VCBS repeat protein n=1 Tax=Kineothrix alysoides TaxID=1469948 RepID=A0A4R1QXM4_9FIRM|nr:hypothetical protein [Kineothrix alysoides]TCL55950.1 hypothetical protein EDD76_11387 [Kineothrix alysoides]